LIRGLFLAFANLNTVLSRGVKDCPGDRNAPPLFNLAWQINALTHPCEMNNHPDSILKALKRDAGFPLMFEQAFGSSGISTDHVLTASRSRFGQNRIKRHTFNCGRTGTADHFPENTYRYSTDQRPPFY